MASKAFAKSLLSFYRIIRRRCRNAHSPHGKLRKYPSDGRLSAKTLVFDVEGGLLRSSSCFPYFMLVALEAGGLLRGLLLLLLRPILSCLSEAISLRVMAMVSFCGQKRDGFRVGRAVLPKHFLEDVGFEGFEVMRRGRRRVCVSRMPRVMVEGFLKEYLEAEVVVGRELGELCGYYTGFLKEEEEEGEGVDGDAYGFGSYSNSLLHHHLFSLCKEVYMVTEAEKRGWRALPRSRYPKPLVFHDGRIAFFPTPAATLTMYIWLPLGVAIPVFRAAVFILLPYKIAVPIGAFTGLKATVSIPADLKHALRGGGSHHHHLYVCNHRTLLDPIYISAALNKMVTAVTYSLSPISEMLSPIPTVRLTRDKEADRRTMGGLLGRGDLVVCPEGTTCREPYLLRFSPLFAELADEVVPVALATSVGMFQGTTASGFKWLDPFYFLLNPNPSYDIRFLGKMRTGLGGAHCSGEVANRAQQVIGGALGFECTALTRKDKYLMLAGNEGIVDGKPNGH